MTNRQVWLEEIQPVETLRFERVEPRYIKLIVSRIIISYLILMALAFLFPVLEADHAWTLLAVTDAVLAAAMAVNLLLARKIYDVRGYALRDKDISYRSGIFFNSVRTMPLGKIQQVSIRRNPLGRIFDLYSVDIIDGSQGTSDTISIPGLSLENAEKMKSFLLGEKDDTYDTV